MPARNSSPRIPLFGILTNTSSQKEILRQTTDYTRALQSCHFWTMLHYRQPVQDENSRVALRKPDPDAENAIPTSRLLGKSFGAGGKTPGLAQRKALGNITNTERKGLSAAAPGLKPRKALGDITNATPLRHAPELGGKQQARSLERPEPSVAKQVRGTFSSLIVRPCRFFGDIILDYSSAPMLS